jgi:hypothetical protein
MSTTTVHSLDGASYECAATTVGALKKAYERKHGVPVDTQTVWVCSSEQELDNAATLAGEAEVQLVIDCQTLTVRVEGRTYELKCRHKSTVGDVCRALEEKHMTTEVAFALDANAYDENGVIATDMVVPMERPAHEYLNQPLRMVCIHTDRATMRAKYHVDLGDRKLIVQLPWLHTIGGMSDSRAMTLELDRTRPDVAAFITLLRMIEERLSVATGSTLELQVPGQRIGYWKCDVRNDDTSKDVRGDPNEVLTGPHYVRGIIQCTDVWNCGGPWVATWVARSLEYRRSLPDAAAAPPCIE